MNEENGYAIISKDAQVTSLHRSLKLEDRIRQEKTNHAMRQKDRDCVDEKTITTGINELRLYEKWVTKKIEDGIGHIGSAINDDPTCLTRLIKSINGNPFAIRYLDKVTNELVMVKDITQYIGRVINESPNEVLGDARIDEALQSYWKLIVKDNKVKVIRFREAQDIIGLVSRNCSYNIFEKLSEMLRDIEKIQPRDLSTPEKGSKLVTFAKKVADAGKNFLDLEIIDPDQVDRLYGGILNATKQALEILNRCDSVGPIVTDLDKIQNIIDTFAERNIHNIKVEQYFEKYENTLMATIGDLLTAIRNVTSSDPSPNDYFDRISPFIIKLIVDHPDSAMRMNAMENYLANKGNLTIASLNLFLVKDLSNFKEKEKEKEIEVKLRALEFLERTIKDSDSDVSILTNRLTSYIKKSKDDDNLKIKAFNILVNHQDLNSIDFDVLNVIGNDQLRTKFFFQICKKICTQDAETLNGFLSKEGWSVFTKIVLDKGLESDQKKRLIDHYIEKSCLKNDHLKEFYILIGGIEDSSVVAVILDKIIFRPGAYSNDGIAKLLSACPKKSQIIIENLGHYVRNENEDENLFNAETMENLLINVCRNIKEIEPRNLNDFIKWVIDNYSERKMIKFFKKDIFHKLLREGGVEKDIKERIININIDLYFEEASNVKHDIKSFISKNLL